MKQIHDFPLLKKWRRSWNGHSQFLDYAKQSREQAKLDELIQQTFQKNMLAKSWKVKNSERATTGKATSARGTKT
ncbi:hypothetical protein [Paenisporosarcina cavernae]|uniref:hypothetical protein n=1 Tax=Paenisporosarcina cavernae TaxID=2320858 RepID=UPI0013C3EC51|nr:hypothetical protein [Paenisporosarcina cavernae]